MRFLQIVIAPAGMTGPPDPAHMAKVRASIDDEIGSGALLATGPLFKRATSAARVIKKNGEFSVEDPPPGEGWMAGGGYSLVQYESKEEAIAKAKAKLALMGDGMVELIQVGEMHPSPTRAPQPAGAPATQGVIPYLTIEGASEAAAFYRKAFGATEVARMLAEDGKRLMHCHLEINGGALMLGDSFPEMGAAKVQRSDSYTMQLVVSDGDRWWNRAIQSGCTEKLPFKQAPWGDKYGQLTDPFGVTWAINSPAQR
jgi:PhnB protein